MIFEIHFRWDSGWALIYIEYKALLIANYHKERFEKYKQGWVNWRTEHTMTTRTQTRIQIMICKTHNRKLRFLNRMRTHVLSNGCICINNNQIVNIENNRYFKETEYWGSNGGGVWSLFKKDILVWQIAVHGT